MKPVTLSGQVARFKGDGRRLGYPTANIRTDTSLAEGVYFGLADLASFTARPAIIFIGVPITMGEQERRVEVHVLDIPDIDYYNQTLNIDIKHFHRPNERFENVNGLLAAMHSDEDHARGWFAKNDKLSNT